MLILLFYLNAASERNLCRFSLNPNCLVKICPAYRIQSVHWTYHVGLSIQEETKKQGQNDWYVKGKGFTLAVGWEDNELFPEGLIFKLLLAGETLNSFLLDGIKKKLCWFSLNPNCLVKICPAYRIQSVHKHTMLDSLFIKRLRNKDKTNAMRKGKASLWLLAGKTVNSFLKNWFSNCCWLGGHPISSYWMEFQN